MIITIDGPAGAGKSSVARRLAQRLGFYFLDTGAMYRAVALAALRRGIDVSQPDLLAALVDELDIRVDGDRVLLDGEDVGQAIRTSEVTALVSAVADHPRVRQRLVQLQRQAAEGRNIVTEGRDQGTVVFPDADLKIFLTASPEVRARRRQAELLARGESIELDELLQQIKERDRRDQSRQVGPLRKAGDAVEINTDSLSLDEVVDRIEALVHEKERSIGHLDT